MSNFSFVLTKDHIPFMNIQQVHEIRNLNKWHYGLGHVEN